MRSKSEINISVEEQLQLVRLPTKLRGMYATWLFGFDPLFTMSRESFYRQAEEIKGYTGVDIRELRKGMSNAYKSTD